MNDKIFTENLLKTIVWLEELGVSCTVFNVHKFFYRSLVGQETVRKALFQKKDTGEIFEKVERFSTRDDVEQRVASSVSTQAFSDRKLMMASKKGRVLASIPFVRAVFVGNTVAFGTADESSDIDLLIVTEKKRIFIVRLLAFVFLTLNFSRRHGSKIKDRLCLSFFISTESLGFAPLRLTDPDVYLAFWLKNLVPLYDSAGITESLEKENHWARELFPNAKIENVVHPILALKAGKIGRFLKKFFETTWGGRYGDLIENQARAMQLSYIKSRSIGNRLGTGDSRVVISDSVLKFHEKDARAALFESWQKRLKELGL